MNFTSKPISVITNNQDVKNLSNPDFEKEKC